MQNCTNYKVNEIAVTIVFHSTLKQMLGLRECERVVEYWFHSFVALIVNYILKCSYLVLEKKLN